MNTQDKTHCNFKEQSTFLAGCPGTSALLDRVDNFACDLAANQSPRWLSLLGKSGRGKTHLARDLYRFARKELRGWIDPEKGNYNLRKFCWIDERAFANEIRSGAYGLVEDLGKSFFLVFDDLFSVANRTDYLLDGIERLINLRLGKWTVITSNLLERDIADKETRIASRLNRGGSDIIEIKKLPDWSKTQ